MPSSDFLSLNPDYAAATNARPTVAAARYQASEASEQIALFAWVAAVLPREPRLGRLFHVPNGEFRHKATAVKLAAMGVQAGVPDLWLPVPESGFVGFVFELKARSGTLSPDQDEWLTYLRAAGWCTSTFWDWPSAAQALCVYLDRTDLPVPPR